MKSFNKKLDDWRKSVISSSSLPHDHKDKFVELANHYCFLHVIINLGEDVSKNGFQDFIRQGSINRRAIF